MAKRPDISWGVLAISPDRYAPVLEIRVARTMVHMVSQMEFPSMAAAQAMSETLKSMLMIEMMLQCNDALKKPGPPKGAP